MDGTCKALQCRLTLEGRILPEIEILSLYNTLQVMNE